MACTEENTEENMDMHVNIGHTQCTKLSLLRGLGEVICMHVSIGISLKEKLTSKF